MSERVKAPSIKEEILAAGRSGMGWAIRIAEKGAEILSCNGAVNKFGPRCSRYGRARAAVRRWIGVAVDRNAGAEMDEAARAKWADQLYNDARDMARLQVTSEE
jgi:hypothetical protein